MPSWTSSVSSFTVSLSHSSGCYVALLYVVGSNTCIRPDRPSECAGIAALLAALMVFVTSISENALTDRAGSPVMIESLFGM